MMRRPATPTLFPYTTLFRSGHPTSDTSDLVPGATTIEDLEGEQDEPQELISYGRDILVVDDNDTNLVAIEAALVPLGRDRKSTRLNSSHVEISYAVFCLKKK